MREFNFVTTSKASSAGHLIFTNVEVREGGGRGRNASCLVIEIHSVDHKEPVYCEFFFYDNFYLFVWNGWVTVPPMIYLWQVIFVYVNDWQSSLTSPSIATKTKSLQSSKVSLTRFFFFRERFPKQYSLAGLLVQKLALTPVLNKDTF